MKDEPQILGTTNGSIGSRKLFQCHPNHGMFVPMSEVMKEEDFFNVLSGHQREVRSVSRCSSRSDRTPLYMNTTSQPTYQNHFFDTEADWWPERDRERQGAARHHRVSTGMVCVPGWRGAGVSLQLS